MSITSICLLLLLLPHGGADLSIAADLMDEDTAEGLEVDNVAEVTLDGGVGSSNTESPEVWRRRRPVKERLECNMERARTGHVDSQYWCGWALYYGMDGYGVNKVEAMKLYEQAALAGHLGAANSLGYGYGKGDGLPKDEHLSTHWFKISAADGKGHPAGMNNYAQALVNGIGCTPDWPRAMELFERAANAGEIGAMYNLGMANRYAQGAQFANFYQAKLWYTRAAEQGHTAAAFAVAELEEYNADNIPEAKRWYSIAAMRGHAEAKAAVRRLRR